MNHAIRCLGIGFAIAQVMAGCHEEEHEEELVSFEVTHPLRQDTEITHAYVCQIHAIQHIELRALERGYLQDIFIDEGQHVAEGTRLFQITPVVYQAELARVSAEAQFADIELTNTRSLREGNVVSEQQLALAQATRDRAQAERDLARAHLSFTSLSAPFDGIVGRLMVRRGSLLEEGELLTVISDNRSMWVYFNVSEAEYLADQAAHREGDAPRRVQLRMANGEMFDQPGVIQTIEADFNNETGTIMYRAGFPNPNRLLRHGETGQVLMANTTPDALVIPQSATFEVLAKRYVFVVDDQGVVHAREINVRAELPYVFIVADGLTADERILLEGLRRVNDGDRINPVERDAAEVLGEQQVHAE